ncbi:hypothetical protein FGE05_08865 [Pseudomonas sp. ICMP22404]|uniref:hypothetical protein n=1 Tax=Pseudomonas sp. ICMP22404 TaxID=2583807 RepID=UPI001117CF6C|nr:hypothetical protein [Pseudomonas sp. ICMP22404]TNF83353.1 hypothetical protein FGE05_08865 [Pseudomonas sp. ICMP22404]
MSFRIYARMAQFPLNKRERVDQSDDPSGPVDPTSSIPDFPHDATFMTTVHWKVQPTLGIASEPFDVELCTQPLSGERFSRSHDEDIQFDDMHFEVSLGSLLTSLGTVEALCVTAIVLGDQDAVIFAVDAAGEEIIETRQPAHSPNGTAFIGPGIFGLRATGSVTLKNLRAFAVPPNHNLEFTQLATVAPAIAGIGAWRQQQYLNTNYDVAGILDVRLAMDALARMNTEPPTVKVLELGVHRRKSAEVAAMALTSGPAQLIAGHYGEIIANPARSFETEVQSGVFLTHCPAKMLQLLAGSDPVTATTLGHAVTVPIKPPFSALQSLEEIYAEVESLGHLPYPLIRVRGHHLSSTGLKVVSEQFAALSFAADPIATIEPGMIHGPSVLDEPGSTELVVRLDRRSASLASFVDLGAGTLGFLIDENGNPQRYIGTGKAEDHSDAGAPTFPLGATPLPLAVPTEKSINIHCSDTFGRWRNPVTARCKLLPWPVQKPSWGAVEVDYPADGTLLLRAEIGWDWTTRTPLEIHVGIVIDPDDPLRIDAQGGVRLPGQEAIPLVIKFKEKRPFIVPGVPPDWSITLLPEYVPDDSPQGTPVPPTPSDFQRYRLQLSLGSAGDMFDTESTRLVGLGAVAWEAVSGLRPERRSEDSLTNVAVHDPRPPQLSGSRWHLDWASRVSGSKSARAFIDFSSLCQKPVAGFRIWRAHESALCDLGLATRFQGDPVAANRCFSELRAERDTTLRLAMIQGLIAPYLHRQTFLRAFINLFEVDNSKILTESGEIEISGAQGGLEFVMLTAVSLTAVPSDKMKLADLRAIAVPVEPATKAPLLRLFRPSVGTLMEHAGVISLAIGSLEPFAAQDVRVFWDGDGGASSEEELLYRVEPVSELVVQHLEQICPGSVSAIERMAIPHWRYFAVRPIPSWMPHSFSADILKSAPKKPSDTIPSPRSELQRVRLVPPDGAALEVIEDQLENSVRSVSIELRNIFEANIPGFAPCMIQLGLVDAPDGSAGSAPLVFGQLVANGWKFTNGTGAVEVLSASGSGRLSVKTHGLSGKYLVIAASDPAGRIDKLTLRL